MLLMWAGGGVQLGGSSKNIHKTFSSKEEIQAS